jgi:hypothetical protein
VGGEASRPAMRALVITESLKGGILPPGVRAARERRYPHELDGTPIEIIELDVRVEDAAAAAAALADALLPRGWYAHLVDQERMIVAFPGEVVAIRRGDAGDVERALATGQRFGIPSHQMRFAEMFETDHPDQPPA